MTFTIVLFLLAAIMLYAAWQNHWEWKAALAAIGTAGAAFWHALSGTSP